MEKFKEDLKKVLVKHQYTGKESDKYGGGQLLGTAVYPRLGGEIHYGQTIREVLEEVFGNIGTEGL